MRMIRSYLGALALCTTLAIAPPAPARQDSSLPGDPAAQPQPRPDRPRRRRPPDQPPPDQRSGSEGQSEAEPRSGGKPEKKKDDRFLAIKGATVHSVSGPVLQNATIVCTNGRITAVGPGVPVPEKAEVIDAAGFHVYPGLIAVRSIALLGGDPPEDTSDVFTTQLVAALGAGITTVATGNTAAKLTYGTLEDMVVKRNLFETIRYGSSDPAAKRRLRESLEKVRQLLRDQKAYEEERSRNPDAKAPDDKWAKSGEAATHLKLLKGEATALADAELAYDLEQTCELAEEFGIRVVVRGAREGWTVAPRMARAGVWAIVTPRTRDDPDKRLMRPNGGTIENAAILYGHGVPVAIVPSQAGVSFGGLGGRDLLQLNLEAAFGVRGGLPEDAAVRSITLDAARILGIDDRVGSIQVGKDADFAIVTGDLLHYTTIARWTIVNGRVAYDKEKETLFQHIRTGGDENAPPPKDAWPRRLGQEQ